jgi:CelD/BcsL family acetyltransferase involved in cellulose biosynthesis
MRIRTIDAYSDEIDAVAHRSSAATFYHSKAWVESLGAVYHRMSFRSLVAEHGGEITGFLPFFYIERGPLRAAWSMPFGTYGGPVAFDGETVSALVDAYADTLSSFRVIEAGWVDFTNTGAGSGWNREMSQTHIMDLSAGFETLWETTIDRQRKKRTRRAERLGVTVRRGRSAEDVARYYDVYLQRAEEWGKGARYPAELFSELLARGGDSVRLYVAEHEGRIIGGHFNFYFGDAVTAWNGVTTPASNHLQPGTLLYIHCLKDACSEGYATYNLGSSLGKRSLIDFKESLGSVPFDYAQYRRRSVLGRAAAWLQRTGA